MEEEVFRFSNRFQVGYGIAVVLVSIFLFFVVQGTERLIVAIIALIFGLFVVAGWFLSPQSLTLTGSNLRVQYSFGERSYSAQDVRAVTLEKSLSRYGYLLYVKIQLKTGGRLKFIHPETDRMYLSIKRWHEQNVRPDSFLMDIPNPDSQD
jgi:hypothetical protein